MQSTTVRERDKFVFTRPDGTRVAPSGRNCFRGNYGAPNDRVATDPGEPPLFALNREAGLDIDWRTSRSKWLGETMDYNQAVQAMLQRTPQGLR